MNGRAQPLVVVENLCKGFEDGEVLNNINLTIEEGDLVSIIGPSGCGKSTLLRCLNCLEIMDRGRLTVCGHTLERDGSEKGYGKDTLMKAHEIRKEVGMVFQSFTLFPHKTVLENVMLAPMVVKGEDRDVAEARAVELLKKVGLGDRMNRYPSTLSGGQTQRAAIARALAMNPRVMLYDEPTSALDPELVGEVLQVMRDLDAEGMTQIIVTHEMRFAKDASDYVVFMDRGEIVEIDDGDVLFSSPKNERTREFLRHLVGTGIA
jgi:polar amino acid transport system ATP-binding protein